ncbi:MAG TPA: hypothetical protein PKV59_07960 [Flexilinea sp.]|nr:hypothetical protein [Flexilinea sp.]
MMKINKNKKRIGVIGTGFIAKGFVLTLTNHRDFSVSKVLTRRTKRECREYPRKDVLTNSVNELMEDSDLIVECSGDAIHAANVIDQALKMKKPVVTMNTEFHVTAGSYFVGKGLVTEAEGDQPGCLAALHEEVTQMGFEPLVYGNVKGFYNPNPTEEEMKFWAKKQGLSLPMVTASTDGTKVQYEQALVANMFKAAIVKTGLVGPKTEDVKTSAFELVKYARRLKQPISDYVINGRSPVRVFIVAKGDSRQRKALEYLKMGKGPVYYFDKNSILTYMEIIKTVRRVLNGGGILLDNGQVPTVSIAAVAKHGICKGTKIEHPVGNFDMRGVAVEIKKVKDHVPMALLLNAVFKRKVNQGAIVCWDDVEIPESLALKAWRSIAQRVLK